MLRDMGITAVYVSDTLRAKETAEPITSSLDLVAVTYPGREVAALIDQVLKNAAGQTVLVVGHSNTVPEMISLLTRGRESVVLDDAEYDAMFIVTIDHRNESALLRLRY
jgi:phosphohistidine phosphatase SixA